MIVVLPEEGIVDMRQILMNTLNSFNEERGCPYCLNICMTEKWQFIFTSQFFFLPIAYQNSRCIPLQNLELYLSME